MSLLSVFFAGAALAGSGPWILGPGDQSLYTGVDVQRLGKLAIQDGPDSRAVIDVGEGLSSFGTKGIVAFGLLSRVELEAELPWYRVQANREDSEVCALLGPGSCATTETVGLVRFQGKWLLMDELSGWPLSLSVAGTLRYGGFTAPTRMRITNVGEGTTDLGPSLHMGRTGGLGSSGYWSAYVDLMWLYRFPSTDAYPDLTGNTPAPRPEWSATSEVLFAPVPLFAFGPSVTGLVRDGLDWYQLDLTDQDRLAALGVKNVRVGGKAVVRNDMGTALSVGYLRTVAAVNNPTDAWVFSMGLSVPAGAWRR